MKNFKLIEAKTKLERAPLERDLSKWITNEKQTDKAGAIGRPVV